MVTRIFAATVAVWFGFLTIQPLYADPCPHHQPALAELAQGLGGIADVGRSMATRAADSHDMSGMGDMSRSGAQGMPNTPGPDRSGGHACHCLGDCCGSAPVAIAQSSTRWVPDAKTGHADLAAMPGVASVAKAVPPHSLPFATAPPTTLLA